MLTGPPGERHAKGQADNCQQPPLISQACSGAAILTLTRPTYSGVYEEHIVHILVYSLI